MKIRSKEALQLKIDEDSVWRKKEMSFLYKRVKKSNDLILKTELRVGVVMLYAHWEGFLKNIFDYYFNYISHTESTYEELASNFQVIEIERILLNSDKTHYERCHKALEFITKDLSKKAFFNESTNTQSNLNFDRLELILHRAGFNSKEFNLKQKLIDEKLLANRNTIAHGNYSQIGLKDFELLYEEIMSIMEKIKVHILNSVILKSYSAKVLNK
jgi:hypothetical protein